MKKNYTLIVQGSYSLSNETDHDAMTDYFPGIWGIKTQKDALKYARELLAEGNEITVSDYNNARYHSVANMFIKELGLKQPLFPEPQYVKLNLVTKTGVPQNLSQLKKYLTVGKTVKIKNFDSEGNIRDERETSVLAVQTNSIIIEKTLGTGTKSWLDIGKATDWSFDNTGATKNYTSNDGQVVPSTRIEYITS